MQGTTPAAGWVDYIYDQAGHAVTLENANGWARGELYVGGKHLSTYGSSTTYFDHSDSSGSMRARTDIAGATVVTCTNLAFGDGLNCSSSDPSWLHFTGLQLDSETNLTHSWFRQLSTTQGRWMTPDPAGMAAVNPANPQTLNRYSYVNNNPVNMVDPLGLSAGDWSDPITMILIWSAGAGTWGSGGISFGGPFAAGPLGSGGGSAPGWTFCCGDRQIVHIAPSSMPGGAAKVRIPGPDPRVMSGLDLATGVDNSDIDISTDMVNNARALAPAFNRGAAQVNTFVAAAAAQATIATGVFAGPAAIDYLAFGARAGRVFYSGYGAGTAALTGAAAYGGTTIGTTPVGRALEFAENGLILLGRDPDALRPVWNTLSGPYAAGASGPVLMYSSWATGSGIGNLVTWGAIEYPILMGNGTPIVWMSAGW